MISRGRLRHRYSFSTRGQRRSTGAAIVADAARNLRKFDNLNHFL
jgi:hypothetical protein